MRAARIRPERRAQVDYNAFRTMMCFGRVLAEVDTRASETQDRVSGIGARGNFFERRKCDCALRPSCARTLGRETAYGAGQLAERRTVGMSGKIQQGLIVTVERELLRKVTAQIDRNSKFNVKARGLDNGQGKYSRKHGLDCASRGQRRWPQGRRRSLGDV